MGATYHYIIKVGPFFLAKENDGGYFIGRSYGGYYKTLLPLN